MYICKKCGNRKYFIEHNCVETEVTIDEETGLFTGNHDTYLACEEVICGICDATSCDGNILDRDTGEEINLDV